MLEELKIKELKIESWRNATDNKATLLVDSCTEIKTILTNLNAGMKRDFVKVGFLLDLIKNTTAYTYALKENSYSGYNTWDKTSFECFCHDYFGMSKSTVYGLIKVWRMFGTSDGGLRPEFEPYTYSQLLEYSYLPDEVSICELKPDMTIKDIRALKPKKEKFSDDEKGISELMSSFDKNGKFIGKIEEPVIQELPVEEPKVKKPEFVFEDLKTKKDDFKKMMKNFFEKFNYTLLLNERKQGGFAFGGVFFAYLQEHGFFDAD